MTTVAWGFGFMASDTLGDQSGLAMPTTKIYQSDEFVIGGSGVHHQCLGYFHRVRQLKFKEVLALGYPEYDEDKNSPAMIMVGRHAPQVGWYLTGSIWSPIHRDFHAIGSGRDFAMAAMAMGRSAHDAVELACKFDVYSGGDIELVEI